MAKKLSKTAKLNLFEDLKEKVTTLIGEEWTKFNEVQWKEFKEEVTSDIKSIPQHKNTETMLKGILGYKIWLDKNYSHETPDQFGRHFLNNVIHDIEGVGDYEKDWYSPRCENYAEIYDKSLQEEK